MRMETGRGSVATYGNVFGLAAVAATSVGGKAVNQDAAGRFVAQPGDPNAETAVVCVADGVTSSPFSEFGAAMAVATAMAAGRDWICRSSETPLPDRLLEHLAACRRAMAEVRDAIRVALAAVVSGTERNIPETAGEEAFRQLALLDGGYAEALCTTVLVVVANRESVVGAAVGNGGIYRIRHGDIASIWWAPAEGALPQHVGADSMPDAVTFGFKERGLSGKAAAVGVVTDGVGSLDRFREGRRGYPDRLDADAVLKEILDRMQARGVAADFLDNLSMAEIAKV
jgi:hypothetical protein